MANVHGFLAEVQKWYVFVSFQNIFFQSDYFGILRSSELEAAQDEM